MSKVIREWIKLFNMDQKAQSGELNLKEIIDVKKQISCLNNLIAVEQTILFLDWLIEKNVIESADKDRIIKNLDSPNAKGYDLYYEHGAKKIVAELKGTIPCINGGTLFGSKQIETITNDLKGLIYGKSSEKKRSISGFSKYMVLFDFAQDAMDSLLGSNNEIKTEIEREGIQIVYLKADARIPHDHCNIDFKF